MTVSQTVHTLWFIQKTVFIQLYQHNFHLRQVLKLFSPIFDWIPNSLFALQAQSCWTLVHETGKLLSATFVRNHHSAVVCTKTLDLTHARVCVHVSGLKSLCSADGCVDLIRTYKMHLGFILEPVWNVLEIHQQLERILYPCVCVCVHVCSRVCVCEIAPSGVLSPPPRSDIWSCLIYRRRLSVWWLFNATDTTTHTITIMHTCLHTLRRKTSTYGTCETPHIRKLAHLY